MSAVTRRVTLPNPQGMHLRPLKQIVQTAVEFEASLTIENADTGYVADGKSAIELMMLQAPQGTELVVTAEGADADSLVGAICDLVESGFGED